MRPKDEMGRPTAAGQSGDTQGLSDVAESTSESVAELVEEGQYFEAGIVNGIENVPEPDSKHKRIRTKEVLEDDVPFEYDRVERPDTDY